MIKIKPVVWKRIFGINFGDRINAAARNVEIPAPKQDIDQQRAANDIRKNMDKIINRIQRPYD